MAGFFNTSWDLGNMFASPTSGQGFTYDESGMPLMDSGITPRPGNEGPGMMPTNTWGAPTGYDPSQQQQGNMFNPYSAGGNNFYNPYQFGQTTTGTQYGGGQQPWWMNYNMGNSVVNPPNVPTTNVQPQAQGQPPRNRGTGPDGKDLTYAETIKYFGLYDGAENAFAAGDKQAAYRQDHMQWRSGTGNYEGMGEGQGQYPGRPELGIAGDEERMGNLSGMFGGFDPSSMFKSSTDENGITKYEVNGEGTMTTGDGTTVETQFMSPEEKEAQDLMLANQQRELQFKLFNPTSSQNSYSQNYTPVDYSNIFKQRGPQSGLPIPDYQTDNFQQQLTGFNQIRFPWGTDTKDSRFKPTEQAASNNNYGVNNSRELIESNLFGVNKPTAVEDAYNQRRFLLMRQESEKQAAMAESKRAAEEYEAKNRAEAAAKSKADAAAAAAEKARQATAAQSRMNNRYETGPVPKNIFTSGTGGSSSGRGRPAPKAPAAPKKTTTTRRYTGRYGL